MIWVILAASALALAVFFERLLLYHSEQINSIEFLNGVRNVLKRDNIVEAIAICDATPGPVARLVKVAILNRDRGREAVREALEDAGAWEVPRLEQKLNLLATIAQIAPLLGLLGTVLGFMDVFKAVEDSGLNAHIYDLSHGVWQALICTAAGLAVSIPSYAGYNYLVGRVNTIVLDMEQVSSEILNIVTAPAEAASRPT
jgi:biopolymer transport protein ExbB